MHPNEKKFIADLKAKGKTLTWPEYSAKYFPEHDIEYARKVALRYGIKVAQPPRKPAKATVVKDNTAPPMTPQEKAYLTRLRKDGVWATNAAMTEEYNPGCTDPEWALKVRERYNYVVKKKEPTAQTKIDDRRRQEELSDVREQNKELASQLSAMQIALERYANISGYDPKKFSIPLPANKMPHETTAIFQISDWHIEEPVLPSTVNGLNQYDLKIAKQRSSKVFENCLGLINTQRSSMNVKELVIHLGGDFITGYIHPEGEQGNSLAPIEACKYAIDLLVSGLTYMLQNGEFNTIRCVCSRGNHGRTTKKNQTNDFEMNYEIFIYYFLMNHFKEEKRIIFKADDSAYSYITVYDRVLRFFHGHQVKYKGGIGGMTVPMVKLILRLNATMPAYFSFCGDKHVLCNPIPRVLVNGSLIGYNTLAAEWGLEFEPPQQSLCFLDSKRGITGKFPVFCD